MFLPGYESAAIFHYGRCHATPYHHCISFKRSTRYLLYSRCHDSTIHAMHPIILTLPTLQTCAISEFSRAMYSRYPPSFNNAIRCKICLCPPSITAKRSKAARVHVTLPYHHFTCHVTRILSKKKCHVCHCSIDLHC